MRRPPWLRYGCLAAVCGCGDRDDVELRAEIDNPASTAAASPATFRRHGPKWRGGVDPGTPGGKSGLPGRGLVCSRTADIASDVRISD